MWSFERAATPPSQDRHAGNSGHGGHVQQHAIHIGFLIHDISRLRHAVFNRYVQPHVGITRRQWWLLINLTRHANTGMTQVELARVMDIGKVALGRMVDRLERNGFVVRVPDHHDRRVKHVKLSAAGQDTVKRMEAIARRLGADINAGIPPDKLLELRDLLAAMKRNLVALDREEPGEA